MGRPQSSVCPSFFMDTFVVRWSMISQAKTKRPLIGARGQRIKDSRTLEQTKSYLDIRNDTDGAKSSKEEYLFLVDVP